MSKVLCGKGKTYCVQTLSGAKTTCVLSVTKPSLEWLKVTKDKRPMADYTCCDCGQKFDSLPPPAETRPDDPEPRCMPCLDKLLDAVEKVPLTDEQIKRIMQKIFREIA